jgi:hypothetical protein
MGCPLPCAPGSVGPKPCGQGPPLVRPDGAGQFCGKVVDVQDEDDDDDEDDEDIDGRGESVGLSDSLPSPALKRWAPGSGPLGCFVLLRGPYGPLAPPVPVGGRRIFGSPLGLWCLWFLCWGTTGGRCFSPTYPGPGVR